MAQISRVFGKRAKILGTMAAPCWALVSTWDAREYKISKTNLRKQVLGTVTINKPAT
jgi:hypothetical protein